MVEPVLYASLGALIATLLWLAFLPAFWSRAVRLSKRRLLDRLPVSASEIIAGQDRLRAEHAIAIRAVERRAENAMEQATAERLAAATARSADLGRLADLADMRAQLARVEADSGRLRYELESVRSGASATAEALIVAENAAAAAAAELAALRKSAAEELEIARRDAEAARLAADQARIEAATREIEIATLRGEIALLRSNVRSDEDRAKPAADPELLRALRLRLDEVADAVAKAAAEPADQPRRQPGVEPIRLVSPRHERAGV